jgi:predicted RNA-binding protein with PUA-like domain
MAGNYWLFKSEPGAYSYEDLVRDGVAEWDGVRNYQARNFLRDRIKNGDQVLFYHSNAKPTAVIGTAVVVKAGYPDDTAWDQNSDHPDPKSSPDNPIWYMVDIRPLDRFSKEVTLQDIRNNPLLEDMLLLKKGGRLSIQPITEQQYCTICKMGKC